jgi:hypothetical protein
MFDIMSIIMIYLSLSVILFEIFFLFILDVFGLNLTSRHRILLKEYQLKMSLIGYLKCAYAMPDTASIYLIY